MYKNSGCEESSLQILHPAKYIPEACTLQGDFWKGTSATAHTFASMSIH